jgi:hypothetical protein
MSEHSPRKNNFTADGGPHKNPRILALADGLRRIGEFESAEMLTAYADLLEQIERAREGVSDAEIMAEWFKADGSVHGPNVETVTMPQAKYLAFRRSVAHLLPSGERGGVDGNWDIVQETIAYLRGCPLAPGLREIRDVADNLANAMHQAVATQPAQAAQVDRTAKDYAIEHAGYLADAAEHLMTATQDASIAADKLDEDDGDDETNTDILVRDNDHAQTVLCAFVELWRLELPGDGHDLIANRNTVRRFVHIIDHLAAQPRAVPDGLVSTTDHRVPKMCGTTPEAGFVYGWNACRSAMLAAAPSQGEPQA